MPLMPTAPRLQLRLGIDQVAARDRDLFPLFQPREDLDAAVINTNYAMSAGLVPAKDALAREDNDSPYANVIAVKSDKKDDPVIQKLIKAYQSDEVKDFINEHFQGSAFAAW